MDDALESIKLDFFELARKLHQVRPTIFSSFEGVTPAEARALLMIGTASRRAEGAVVRPGGVAAHMHLSPSALSQVLKSLEGKGLVVRKRESGDFRAVSVVLTDAGARLAREVEDKWEKQAFDLVSCVGADEFRAMLKTAHRIVDYALSGSSEGFMRAGEASGCPASAVPPIQGGEATCG